MNPDELPDDEFDLSEEIAAEFEDAQSFAPLEERLSEDNVQISDTPDLQTRSMDPREISREIGADRGATPHDGNWEHHVVPLNEESPAAERARDAIDEAGGSLHASENIASLPDTRDEGYGVTPTEGATLHNDIHSAEHGESYMEQIADRLEQAPPDERMAELAAINTDLHEGRITPVSNEVVEDIPIESAPEDFSFDTPSDTALPEPAFEDTSIEPVGDSVTFESPPDSSMDTSIDIGSMDTGMDTGTDTGSDV